MCRKTPEAGGLRLSPRHLLIVLIYGLVLFGGILPTLRNIGLGTTRNLLLASVQVSPPLLAMLVLLIDRPGPVKNWAVSILLYLFYPALALNHDLTALRDYLVEGRSPSLLTLLVLNSVFVVITWKTIGRLVPRTCPGCARRTLIRLMQLLREDRRTSRTYWCASCGGKYWADPQGELRVERRRTWLDGWTGGGSRSDRRAVSPVPGPKSLRAADETDRVAAEGSAADGVSS